MADTTTSAGLDDVDAHVDEVRTQGFTILRDVIEPDLVADLRRTLRVLQDERPNLVQGTIYRSVGLLGEAPVFEVPPLHPAVFPVVEGVLGSGCLLTLYDALDVTPGVNKQPLHNDDALMPLQRPHQPLVCTTLWALTDFTEENGATRVVPGSHLRPDLPDYAKHAGEYDTMPVEMSEGSVVVFDGALWHTSGENNTADEWRLGLQVSYCAGFIRPLQNLLLSIPPETAAGYPDELLMLCGYATYNGIGQVIKHGAQDVVTRSPAAQVLGREPLPDAARVSHLERKAR